MAIEVRELRFGYGARQVLKGISFSVGSGQLASVLGPNGVGKSTLFKCMLGLRRGYTGQVLLDGVEERRLGARALARRIAYIPQSNYPAFNYTVLDMVLMGTSSRTRAFAAPGEKELQAARAALARLGLTPFEGRGFMHLSGGERQLVLIARALAQDSRILVLDEPTANLDYGNQMTVMSRLRQLAAQGYTILQSTHNPEQAYMFSDLLLAMKDGRLIAQGAPPSVLTTELMHQLYGMKVRVESLAGDSIRVCVPSPAESAG